VPTFPEALTLGRASYRKTGSHFSGSTHSWSCFLSENRCPLFRKHSLLTVLLIGKPVPTFPEALTLGRASYRKTGAHFSGSTHSWPCFLSENRCPLFRKHSLLTVLLIGKPVPTFPEALTLGRASYRKTGAHFSGSTHSWPCFLSENRCPLFRKHSLLVVLLIGKPVPTFPEALTLGRASHRKTGPHFSGSTHSWSCFLSENRFPLFRKHSRASHATRNPL